jgi:hypothetical protein
VTTVTPTDSRTTPAQYLRFAPPSPEFPADLYVRWTSGKAGYHVSASSSCRQRPESCHSVAQRWSAVTCGAGSPACRRLLVGVGEAVLEFRVPELVYRAGLAEYAESMGVVKEGQ